MKSDRSDDEPAHQLLYDSDVAGGIRAAGETKLSQCDPAVKALTEAARHDPFWAGRLQAVRVLSEFKTEAARGALLGAAKDKKSRIRRAAIQGLSAFKGAKPAELFIITINTNPSFFSGAEATRAGSEPSASGLRYFG